VFDIFERSFAECCDDWCGSLMDLDGVVRVKRLGGRLSVESLNSGDNETREP
jgi:hypothetical protein